MYLYVHQQREVIHHVCLTVLADISEKYAHGILKCHYTTFRWLYYLLVYFNFMKRLKCSAIAVTVMMIIALAIF